MMTFLVPELRRSISKPLRVTSGAASGTITQKPEDDAISNNDR